MKLLAWLLVAIIAIPAFAEGDEDVGERGSFASSDVNVDVAGAVAEAVTGPVSSSSEGASVGAITNQLSIENPEERAVRAVLNVPYSRAPTAYPTSPCVVGKSSAFGIPILSRSKGEGIIDEACQEREEVRLAPTDAHKLYAWCHIAGIAEKFGSAELCIEYAAPVPPKEEYPQPPVGAVELGKQELEQVTAVQAAIAEQSEEHQKDSDARRAKARVWLQQLEKSDGW